MKEKWIWFKQQLSIGIEKLNRHLPPLRLGMLLMFIISTVFLFAPPAMGMVDTGEYSAILRANGLREIPGDTNYYRYFVTKYPILQYYNADYGSYVSIANVPLQLAILLNKWFYSQQIFDIRFLALVYEVLFLIGFYFLLKRLLYRLPAKKAYIMMALTVFLLSDATYIGYFNSFYYEATAFILVIYFVGLNLAIYQETNDRKRFRYYVFAVIVTILFMMVSHMLSVIAIGMVVTLSAGLIMVRYRPFRISAAFVVFSILPIGFMIDSLYESPFAQKQVFESETTGAMVAAKDPESAATYLNIAPQYEMLRNQKYREPYALAQTDSKKIQQGMMSHLSTMHLSWYYFMHPKELWRMLGIALENKNLTRSSGLAFERGQQYESWRQLIFQGATMVKGAFMPKKFGFYLILAIIIISMYGVSAYRGYLLGEPRYIARFISKSGMLLVMFLSFLTPIIFSGTGNMNRTLLTASVVMDLLVLIVIADFLRKDIWIERDQMVMAEWGVKFKNEEKM